MQEHATGQDASPEMSASMLEAENLMPEQQAIVLLGEIAHAPGVTLEAIPEFVPLDEAVHWRPILQGLGPDVAAEFTWAVTTDTVETYEHRQTRRYLHIDGLTGEFLNQQCETISAAAALEHARRPATAKVAPMPEPRVEEFVQEDVAVSAAFAAESPEPSAPAEGFGTEPELNAFTRRHGLAPETPFWSGIVAKVDGLQTGMSNRLGLVADAKRKLLAKAPAWGGRGFAGAHETAAGNNSAPDGQQPTFAAFTRRTSAL